MKKLSLVILGFTLLSSGALVFAQDSNSSSGAHFQRSDQLLIEYIGVGSSFIINKDIVVPDDTSTIYFQFSKLLTEENQVNQHAPYCSMTRNFSDKIETGTEFTFSRDSLTTDSNHNPIPGRHPSRELWMNISGISYVLGYRHATDFYSIPPVWGFHCFGTTLGDIKASVGPYIKFNNIRFNEKHRHDSNGYRRSDSMLQETLIEASQDHTTEAAI